MKVIFVCTGNTCRSPLAQGYLKSLKLKNVEVSSRGLFANGDRVSENSKAVAQENRFDISEHISKQFSSEDLKADRIVCLSQNHLDMLLSVGADREKLLLLGDGIADPYGMPLEIYRICAKQIFDAVDSLVFAGAFGDFSVQSVIPEDIPQIARLEAECFSEPWSENAISESIFAGTRFFAAKQGTLLCGYIGISTILDEGYITNVAVFKGYRNKGIATMLLNRTFSLARELGLQFISLEVRASNQSAISLYEKLGFRREALRKNFYSNPKEDAIIMTRRFVL